MSKRPPKGAPADEEALAGSSIRVVANRTGIAADTLRMWERRYGFPRPSRRSGGSRVYSEEDVAHLHLVARAVDAGFRPSEVVTLGTAELTRLVNASVADAPPRTGGANAARLRTAAPGAEAARSNGAALGGGAASTASSSNVDALIEALKGEDIVGLRALLRAAALAYGPRSFVTEVAHPLAVRVGELWAEGALEVRHEHLATACLTSQLHLLLGALDDGERSPKVLLATLPAEPHLLGIDMVSVYLAASLAAPRVLGADTPPAQIVDAAHALGVDAVGISISPVAERRAASRCVKALAAGLPPNVELWLGGAGSKPLAATAPSARIVGTWSELDAALVALRTRLTSR